MAVSVLWATVFTEGFSEGVFLKGFLKGLPKGLLAGCLLAASGLAGCSGGSSVASGGDVATPHAGGTLRLAGSADVYEIDPAVADSVPAHLLLRALTRQLVGHRVDGDRAVSGKPVPDLAPDLAEELPAPSAGGTTYTFRIRKGAYWDTTPPRQIIAADVVRGFQRLCNPVASGGMPAYFPELVVGMAKYCRGFTEVAPEVPALRNYLDTHQISGVRALDDRTVRFVLTHPSGDFLDLLALPFASPVPVEALGHLPGSPSFRGHFLASGPYSIASYDLGRRLMLRRNRAWQPASDPVRRAYVDRIEITCGLDAGAVQRRLETGEADLAWDTEVPAGDVDRLAGGRDTGRDPDGGAERDGRLVFADAGTGGAALVLNLASSTENRAMSNLRVRQALNYAVDKRAVVDALGGPQLFRPRDEVLPATAPGYEKFNLYPTPEHRGDPVAARQLLDSAGYPHGLTLTLGFPDTTVGRRLGVALAGQLANSGITLRLSRRDGGTGSGDEGPPGDTREDAGSGGWDLALVDTPPAWPGSAAASAFAQILPSAPATGGSGADAAVARMVWQALAAPEPKRAASLWARANKQAMQSAITVPLATGRGPRYRSVRVRGWVATATFPRGDIANLWLAT